MKNNIFQSQTHIVNHLNLGGQCACSKDAVGYKWTMPHKVDCPECLKILENISKKPEFPEPDAYVTV